MSDRLEEEENKNKKKINAVLLIIVSLLNTFFCGLLCAIFSLYYEVHWLQNIKDVAKFIYFVLICGIHSLVYSIKYKKTRKKGYRTAAIIQNVIYGSMLLVIIFIVYFVVFHFYWNWNACMKPHNQSKFKTFSYIFWMNLSNFINFENFKSKL